MTGTNDEDEEWLPVLPPAYAAARARHRLAREEAYVVAREDSTKKGICGPDLRITDLDERALNVWTHTWRGNHPSGAGGWPWPSLLEQLPHRAAVLPIAILYGDDLCGLALGQASKRRFIGSRHTITRTRVERRPEPPDVPVRGTNRLDRGRGGTAVWSCYGRTTPAPAKPRPQAAGRLRTVRISTRLERANTGLLRTGGLKMKILTAVSPVSPRAPGAPGFLMRLRNWLLDVDDYELTREEARRRMRSRPGLFASMSPEDLAYLRAYDGPENSGPPLTRRERRDLERRIAAHSR